MGNINIKDIGKNKMAFMDVIAFFAWISAKKINIKYFEHSWNYGYECNEWSVIWNKLSPKFHPTFYMLRMYWREMQFQHMSIDLRKILCYGIN